MAWDTFLFTTQRSRCIEFIGYNGRTAEVYVSFYDRFRRHDYYHAYAYNVGLIAFEELFFADSTGAFVVAELRPLGCRDADLRELQFNIDSVNRVSLGLAGDALPLADVACFDTAAYDSRVSMLDAAAVFSGFTALYAVVPDFYPGCDVKSGVSVVPLPAQVQAAGVPGGLMVMFTFEPVIASILVDDACIEAASTTDTAVCSVVCSGPLPAY